MTMLNRPAQFGDARANAAVVGSIALYQATLQKRALKLGDRLFARRPKVFSRSVGSWLIGRQTNS
jgi:hypothetical protein